MTCSAVENNAGGTVDITWSSVAGVSSWDVYRDDTVIQTTAGTSANDTPGIGVFTYKLRSILNGVVMDTPCGAPVNVGPVLPSCTATLGAGDTVTISWDPVAGQDDFQLRRNGQWVKSVNVAGDPTPSTTDSPGPGTWAYEIRFWAGAGPNDVSCPPSITIGGGGPTCTAALNPNGTVTLTWSNIPGVTEHYIRVNNTFVQTVGDVTTATVTPAGQGTFAYDIRYWNNGPTDIPCNPSIVVGAPMMSCTAVPFGGGVQIDWLAVPGEVDYFVRKNGSWLANVSGALTYVDPAGTAGDTYVIRYFEGGAQDIPCA